MKHGRPDWYGLCVFLIDNCDFLKIGFNLASMMNTMNLEIHKLSCGFDLKFIILFI